MRPGRLLRQARRRAGLTQMELAGLASVPQSTVARIEIGAIDPRATTLDRLLRACDYELESVPLLGRGIDTSLIDLALRRRPVERLEENAAVAQFVSRLQEARAVKR